MDVKLIEKDLMGKAYMPGGNLAQYKAGKQKYELFLAKAPKLRGRAAGAAFVQEGPGRRPPDSPISGAILARTPASRYSCLPKERGSPE